MSETEGPKRRGKPVVKWEDRVKEYSSINDPFMHVQYMHERGVDRGGM